MKKKKKKKKKKDEKKVEKGEAGVIDGLKSE